MFDSMVRQSIVDALRAELSESGEALNSNVAQATSLDNRVKYFRSKLPTTFEHINTTKVTDRTRVVKDRWGVAHCYGETLFDLFFAAGVAQAQDRLWQLDYRRRFAHGNLSEIMGSQAIKTDVAHRILGFSRAVKTEATRISQEADEALTGFAAGVNTWIEHVIDRLPFEFDVLDYEPSPWRAEDSLVILRHFWWTLTGRLDQIIAAERVLRSVDQEQAQWLLRPETTDYIVPTNSKPTEDADFGSVSLEPDTPGSNNWVAGPSLTSTGRPVLAADPHWPLAFPDMWYEQQLSGAGFDCVGAAYPGVPPVIFGRNRTIAWGRTNNVTSTRDLYHELTNPEDESLYKSGNQWRPFDEVHEEVDVRGNESTFVKIRLTERGPVVNDLIPPVSETGDGPITLRWVGHEQLGDIQALLDINRASDADQLEKVLGSWRLSVWNAVYADTLGHYGYQMCGNIPVRASIARGTRQADNPKQLWQGYIRTPDLPRAREPKHGWVASANNPPCPPSPELPLHGAYADGYRFRRIKESLSSVSCITPQEVAALQTDNLSIRALELKDLVANIVYGSRSALANQAAKELLSWNAKFDLDQVGATIWAAFWPRWVKLVGETVLPPFAAELASSMAGGLARYLLTDEPPVFYKGDTPSDVRAAMGSALTYLTSALGKSMSEWRWGSSHHMRLEHPIVRSGRVPDWLKIAPIECAGGEGVINQRRPIEHPDGFRCAGGPSYRFMADLSADNLAYGSLIAGQSGQPGSPHYSDQTNLWPFGKLHPLLMDSNEIEAAKTSETLIGYGFKNKSTDSSLAP